MALSDVILRQTAAPSAGIDIGGALGQGLRTGAGLAQTGQQMGILRQQAQVQKQRFSEEQDQKKLISMANDLNTALMMGPGQAQDDILKQTLAQATPGTAPAISINAAISNPNPVEKQNLLKQMVQNAQQRGLLQPVPGKTDVAGVREFEYLTEGLTPDESAKARRIKLGLDPRASEDAVSKAEKAYAVEKGKLEARYRLSPAIAAAVTEAKNTAVATVKEAGAKKSNQTAWNVYNNSMSNLAQAMEGTETGPVVGLIPAITANQQIAEGAVAVMAPVLKQMFRSAGEGTFTDKDQEMLLKMVPTRSDLPEARLAKIKAIDAIVRAKLGITGDTAKTVKPLGEISTEELNKIAFGE